ncbi:MAG: transcription antitermination factor NusB [Deltaproteobacteria bacterium]|nr:transcription antitermination factor NusB [Deltaproteobacteria bacterium]MBW2135934.1 transcription antitermination factor NusB [Deltaproteobacteria bacterium]
MGTRRKARELAVQVLFHLEFNPGEPEEAFQLIGECFGPSKYVRPFSRQLVLGVCEKQQELDKLIRESSRNWRLERMSHVDRNVLRIGAYELLYMKDIPPKVTINEAVEMGKKYGTEESGAFINGILDNIYNRLKQDGCLEEKRTGKGDIET